MAFGDLTAEQQAALAEYVRMLRAWSGEQALATRLEALVERLEQVVNKRPATHGK